MKKLELKFLNEDGKTVTYSLEKPIEPVDAAKVNSTMDDILTQDAFTSSGGNLASKKSARIVERNVKEIELPE
ncbi:DUF2922 domain-containing protein [Lentibacillus cibarius]|uniref:DUF2922 domain-containing protein n=1 Tax=Lentibacillus cibarius TaxID=2583219 RepID=A0A549YG59_9BACI|nr:DUF2922 domain-containing protein [Lentibacillus cibarius]TMN22106.1 DUF2922 domain-containing protein [Lentibacillus cibarius]TRM10879.1 DUF2922 domain-containing protein [Lentibacillus cibarius]